MKDTARRRTKIQETMSEQPATWAAVRGDDPLRIKQRAGHASFSTTEGYIREAENLREGFGDVFPGLPPGLTGARLGQGFGQVDALPADFTANLVEQRGIEPRTSALRTRRSPS